MNDYYPKRYQSAKVVARESSLKQRRASGMKITSIDISIDYRLIHCHLTRLLTSAAEISSTKKHYSIMQFSSPTNADNKPLD